MGARKPTSARRPGRNLRSSSLACTSEHPPCSSSGARRSAQFPLPSRTASSGEHTSIFSSLAEDSEHLPRTSSRSGRTDRRHEQHPSLPAAELDTPALVQHTTLKRIKEVFDVRYQPRQQRYIGRVIPDSQEDPTEYDLDDFDDQLLEIPDSEEDPTDYVFDNSEELVIQEIPDRQEDSKDHDYSSSDAEEELEPVGRLAEVLDALRGSQQSYDTVDTVVVPGGTKLKPRKTLFAKGINVNGQLACEHHSVDKDMEEQATQPSTQPRYDQRRNGTSNMLSLDEEADVVCILHPLGPAAYRAAELIAKLCPQHILQNAGLSGNLENEELQESPQTRRNDEGLDTERSFEDLPENMLESPALDIALRLSSKVHDVRLGWTFGRNLLKCDLPLVGQSETLKISNMHFRIFLNNNEITMLADTSTNGTWVDDTHLLSKNEGSRPTRTLNMGTRISILLSSPDPCMRFVVNVPDRSPEGLAKYMANLREYRETAKRLENEAAVAAEAVANGKMMGPPPIIPFSNTYKVPSHAPIQSVIAHSSYPHGMAWNGGEAYNVVARIGKGAFANVYKISTKQDGEVFAAKEIELRRFLKDGNLGHKAHNEIDVMKQLIHPNIVRYVDYAETAKHIFIIMEYVPHGDLTQYTTGATLMPEFNCCHVAHQMMSALDYLHKHNVTHRDIKPDNILVASQDPFVVKLTDFGLSKVVADDLTFLKTFCGTLLYCAPEVYPQYEKVKAGLPQKRPRGDEKPRSPYTQSADTWAFAAVLYHLLCGKPPYTGTAEDRGSLMLENVMNNDVDFARLTRAGVSLVAVDFVRKMLVHEPDQRASDTECLRHPWIAELSGYEVADVEMEAVEDLPAMETEAQEQNASQLSYRDPPNQAQLDDSDEEHVDADELEQLRRSKRAKLTTISTEESYDPLDMMTILAENRDLVRGIGGRAPDRLFGEVGESALRSSGVLGENAVAALDITVGGSHEGDVDEGIGASGTSAMNDATESHVTNDGISQHAIQYPQILPAPAPAPAPPAGPAPSLLGTEALVDQMNMASPESGPSGPSVDSKSGTPHTPPSRELSPSLSALAGAKRYSQEIQTENEHTTSKRPKSHRSSNPSKSSRKSHSEPTPPKASRTGRRESSDHHKSDRRSSTSKPQTHKTAAAQETQQGKGQRSGDAGKGEREEKAPSTAEVPPQQDTIIPGSHAVTQPNDGSQSSSNSASNSGVQDAPAPAPEFAPPDRILGRLNTVPGSVIDTTHFNLTRRLTYYGRTEEKHTSPIPYTSYVYPHSTDSRVPKNALDLMFWRDNIENDERAGKNVLKMDDYWCILMTRTSTCVWVNGVELKRGKDCIAYGKIYTGDIITIFGPKYPGAQGKAAEYLKFECEFFVGNSKKKRKPGSPFKIRYETEHYQAEQARLSRESSALASTTGSSTTPQP